MVIKESSFIGQSNGGVTLYIYNVTIVGVRKAISFAKTKIAIDYRSDCSVWRFFFFFGCIV